MPTWGSALGWVWGTRTGKVTVVILLFVAGACLARLVLGPVDEQQATPQPAAHPPAGAPTAGSPGTAAPLEVADAFAHGWVAPGSADEWYGRLLPHATPALAARLASTDPAALPAGHITGQPTVTTHTGTAMEFAYPVEGGTLGLQLARMDGRWLVDDVQWQPR